METKKDELVEAVREEINRIYAKPFLTQDDIHKKLHALEAFLGQVCK